MLALPLVWENLRLSERCVVVFVNQIPASCEWNFNSDLRAKLHIPADTITSPQIFAFSLAPKLCTSWGFSLCVIYVYSCIFTFICLWVYFLLWLYNNFWCLVFFVIWNLSTKNTGLTQHYSSSTTILYLKIYTCI